MTQKTSYQPGEPSWIDLGTPNMEATLAFYGGLFGWTADEPRGEEFGGYRTLRKDGKSVGGVMPLMSPEQPPVWTCYVSTDDADKVAALVSDGGGQVFAPPMQVESLGRMAVFADPTGAAFGIWEPGQLIGADICDEEGAMQWVELSTRNQSAALPFYETVFGWQPKVTEEYTEFQLGGQSVAGCMTMADSMPAHIASYWMPYFGAAQPGEQASKAIELGGSVLVPESSMGGVTFAIAQDPHGSTFGLLRIDG